MNKTIPKKALSEINELWYVPLIILILLTTALALFAIFPLIMFIAGSFSYKLPETVRNSYKLNLVYCLVGYIIYFGYLISLTIKRINIWFWLISATFSVVLLLATVQKFSENNSPPDLLLWILFTLIASFISFYYIYFYVKYLYIKK